MLVLGGQFTEKEDYWVQNGVLGLFVSHVQALKIAYSKTGLISRITVPFEIC